MLFGFHDLPFLAGFAGVVVGLTAVIAVGIDTVNQRRPTLTVILSALSVPIVLMIAAMILGRPDPRSVDGPAMVMLYLLFLALVSVPVSLSVSGLIVWIRRLRKP